jgi:hypothetical protein
MKFRRRIVAVFLVWIFSIVSSGCGRKPSPEDPDAPAGSGNLPVPVRASLDCPNGTALTWQNFGGFYLRRYCASCHAASLSGDDRRGAPSDISFDSAADALAFRMSMLKVAASDDGTMPPGVVVPFSERALFREWLNCGAP